MAAITADQVVSEGSLVSAFEGIPQRVKLTTQSTSDTYQHPVGVSAWAIKPGVADTFSVTYSSSTRTFTITSAAGGDVLYFFIWPTK